MDVWPFSIKEYIIQDCLQVPLDEEYNEIVIYYYTYRPNGVHDAFDTELYSKAIASYGESDQSPLYLCREVWKWENDRYVKKEVIDHMLSNSEAQALIEKYLRIVVPFHCWDLNYIDWKEKDETYKYSLLRITTGDRYTLGINSGGVGGRWERSYLQIDTN